MPAAARKDSRGTHVSSPCRSVPFAISRHRSLFARSKRWTWLCQWLACLATFVRFTGHHHEGTPLVSTSHCPPGLPNNHEQPFCAGLDSNRIAKKLHTNGLRAAHCEHETPATPAEAAELSLQLNLTNPTAQSAFDLSSFVLLDPLMPAKVVFHRCSILRRPAIQIRLWQDKHILKSDIKRSLFQDLRRTVY